MKLALLVDQIVAAAPVGMLTDQMIYASLDFFGHQNSHLAIPEWHSDEFRTLEMQRHEFLTGEEEIQGDVLVFRYNRNAERMRLTAYATIVDAAQEVCGPAGIFNVWVDLLLVFERFRIRTYRASYRSKNGKRVVLDRSQWDPPRDQPFEDRRIEWLDS